MRRLARWTVLGVLGFAVAPTCGDAFGIDDVLGIWNTQSIGGHSVPGTVVYEGDSYDTQYVRWAFYDGPQCTLTQRVDGVTATYDECDYTVSVEHETITIVFLSEVWDGGVEGNRMTLTDPQDVLWILRRQ
ncbi:MAG: hypothetical protein ACE5PT_01560 [Gemmatimonadales bacterium]